MRTPTLPKLIAESLSNRKAPSAALKTMALLPVRRMTMALVVMVAMVLMAVPLSASSTHDGENLVAVSFIPEVGGISEMAPHDGTFWLGVDMVIREGWHVYWRNPGDSGLPTTIRWDPHPYLTPGEIHWPRPSRFDEDGITTYGYSGSVTLLVPVVMSPDGTAGNSRDHPLTADINWLVCKEICLPESATVSMDISEEGAFMGFSDSGAERIAHSMDQVPQNVEDWQGRAVLADRKFEITLTPVTENAVFPDEQKIYFYPDRQGLIEHTAPQTVRREGDNLTISIPVSRYLRTTPEKLHGVLSAEGSWVRDHNRPAIELILPVTYPTSGK